MDKNLQKIIRPFHLAIPVSDLERSMKFYENILGCSLGRSSGNWIDLDFFNHQLVIHQSNNLENIRNKYYFLI